MNENNEDQSKGHPNDKVRRRILQYASDKFAVSGYSNVSIAQFASELKMSKSTFYKYYQSKEELLYAVIETFYSDFEEEIAAIASDSAMNTGDKIQAFAMAVRRRFENVRVSSVEDLQRSAPEAYEVLEQRRKKIITGNLIRLFEQGVSSGYIRKDVSPMLMANLLLQALQYLEHPGFIAGMNFTFPEMFKQVFSILMEGSLTETGRGEFREAEEERT